MKKLYILLPMLLAAVCACAFASTSEVDQILSEKNTVNQFNLYLEATQTVAVYNQVEYTGKPTFQFWYSNGQLNGALALQASGNRFTIQNMKNIQTVVNNENTYFGYVDATVQINRERLDAICVVEIDKVNKEFSIVAYADGTSLYFPSLKYKTPICANYWSSRNPTVKMC